MPDSIAGINIFLKEIGLPCKMDIVTIVNRSKHEASQKVVQLYMHEKPYMLVGDSTDYHKHLLEGFLKDNDVSFRMQSICNKMLPALSGPQYKVAGMGFADMDFSQKRCKGIYGNSYDYDMPVDKPFTEMTLDTLRQQGWKVW
jgi:hypothetical protein